MLAVSPLWLAALAVWYSTSVEGGPPESTARNEPMRLRRLDGPYGVGYGRWGFQGSYGVPLPQPGYAGKVPGVYTRPPGVTLLPTNTGVMYPRPVLGVVADQRVYAAGLATASSFTTAIGGYPQVAIAGAGPVLASQSSASVLAVSPGAEAAVVTQPYVSDALGSQAASVNQEAGTPATGSPSSCPEQSIGDLLVLANRLREGNIRTRQAAIEFLQSDADYRNCSVAALASIVDIQNLAEYLLASKTQKTEDSVWKELRSIAQLRFCSDDEVYALSRQAPIKRIYDPDGIRTSTHSLGAPADETGRARMDAGADDWCQLQPEHPLCQY
ncbi:hypothetical protein BESB_027600 [Besnoitia besnoiti]|uniref:Uncharacterized protein n=1 Tax=Besnoitia besnoiti TaxID=94643 RepID=A0A2A9M015_BESBE|nr:uncharacterized protein BESB_027600 [Besnoitia besnoiti]PFH31325.1 hypothetical protein BESB_027600 [Besnoitia besnoiti]